MPIVMLLRLRRASLTWKRRQRGVMLHRCFQSLRDLPKPIVAAVNGYCLGAGLELMASCDFIIASDRAQFAMPEIDFAIPSIVEAAIPPRMIGILKARELVMTGDRWSAAEALAAGLVNRVVPHAELQSAARTLAGRLAAKSAKAMAVQKDSAISGSTPTFSRRSSTSFMLGRPGDDSAGVRHRLGRGARLSVRQAPHVP